MTDTPNRWWEASLGSRDGSDGREGGNNVNAGAHNFPPLQSTQDFPLAFMTNYFPQNSTLDQQFPFRQFASPTAVHAAQSSPANRPSYDNASNWQLPPAPLRNDFNQISFLSRPGDETISRDGDWLDTNISPHANTLDFESPYTSLVDLTESPIEPHRFVSSYRSEPPILESPGSWPGVHHPYNSRLPRFIPDFTPAMPVTRSSRRLPTPRPTPRPISTLPAEPNVQERAPKRRRVSNGPGSSRSSAQQPTVMKDEDSEIEEVDLTEVNSAAELANTLAKQRKDAVDAQRKSSRHHLSGRTALSSYKCPICMDTPEDATTTICGHLFCHKCIIDTLRWSERQRQDEARNNKAKGTCPVCRKALAIKDGPGTARTLIPLQIKMVRRRDLGKGTGNFKGKENVAS